MKNHGFTQQEWEICLKVLATLKENPLNNPDNQTFKTLITSIHKQAKKELNKQEENNTHPETSDTFETLISSIHKNAQKEIRKEKYTAKKQEDGSKIEQTVIISKAQSNTTLYTHENTPAKQDFQELHLHQNCYVCHQSYRKLHFFYHKLCPECAEENYHYRQLSPDFEGYQVVLTGGRVKIGYATALQLLRAKAKVLLTTRFPAIALELFSKEADFEVWQKNLTLYGLDLRNINSVYEFTKYCKDNLTSLDILINNAAQTIKYTPEYYKPLIANEKKQLNLLQNNEILSNKLLIPNLTPIHKAISNNLEENLDTQKDLADFLGLETPKTTRFGQPVDFRSKNSWNATLEEISLEELLEVNVINHISPYILISELKPLMLQSANNERFVINVTSSEGQFSYAQKTIHHPHTNMTKAALNMLTRTSASDFVKDNIFMNAVDVGWISTGANEEKRSRLFANFQIPPLDSVDGAMRIIQPIMDIINGNKALFGKLLKNYQVVEW